MYLLKKYTKTFSNFQYRVRQTRKKNKRLGELEKQREQKAKVIVPYDFSEFSETVMGFSISR